MEAERATTSATENKPADADSDFEISNLNAQVMGEMVRPAGANLRSEISDLK